MRSSDDSFFGTKPTGEHMRSGKGGSLKGPTIRPSETSFSSLSLINCGSCAAVERLSRVLGLKGPEYSKSKPRWSPWMMYCTFSLSGWCRRSSLSLLILIGVGGT